MFTAYTTEPRAITVGPSLGFDGTAVLCEVVVTDYDKTLGGWCVIRLLGQPAAFAGSSGLRKLSRPPQ